MAPKPKKQRPAAAGSDSKTAAGCSDDLSQDDLKSLKTRRPQAESKPQVASTTLSVAGMVLAFALGWGGRGMRPDDAAQSGAPDVWEHTTHPGMREGFNWTQLSMSRANNFPPTFVRHLSVEEIEERGAFSVWHRTYARSIPALISGLARNWSTRMSAWTLDDFLREWGEQPVTVAFSRDEKFQRGVAHPTEGRVIEAPDRLQLPFKEFVRLQREQQSRAGGPVEHIAVQQPPSNPRPSPSPKPDSYQSPSSSPSPSPSPNPHQVQQSPSNPSPNPDPSPSPNLNPHPHQVQQSPSRSFAEFGLPSLPPLLEELVGPTLQAHVT